MGVIFGCCGAEDGLLCAAKVCCWACGRGRLRRRAGPSLRRPREGREGRGSEGGHSDMNEEDVELSERRKRERESLR